MLTFKKINVKRHSQMADVAQLVEPRFVVPVVVGSSPIVRPIIRFLYKRIFFIDDRSLRARSCS